MKQHMQHRSLIPHAHTLGNMKVEAREGPFHHEEYLAICSLFDDTLQLHHAIQFVPDGDVLAWIQRFVRSEPNPELLVDVAERAKVPSQTLALFFAALLPSIPSGDQEIRVTVRMTVSRLQKFAVGQKTRKLAVERLNATTARDYADRRLLGCCRILNGVIDGTHDKTKSFSVAMGTLWHGLTGLEFDVCKEWNRRASELFRVAMPWSTVLEPAIRLALPAALLMPQAKNHR